MYILGESHVLFTFPRNTILSGRDRRTDYLYLFTIPFVSRFGGVPIDQAAGWTWNWQEENVVSVAGNTPTYIAETVSHHSFGGEWGVSWSDV